MKREKIVKKYHTLGTLPNYVRKLVERDKAHDTPNTHIHDRTLY
jgi:hypothetical protein